MAHANLRIFLHITTKTPYYICDNAPYFNTIRALTTKICIFAEKKNDKYPIRTR